MIVLKYYIPLIVAMWYAVKMYAQPANPSTSTNKTRQKVEVDCCDRKEIEGRGYRSTGTYPCIVLLQGYGTRY